MHILDAILALPGGPWLVLGAMFFGGLLAVPWRPEDAAAMHATLDRLITDVLAALRRSPDAPTPPAPARRHPLRHTQAHASHRDAAHHAPHPRRHTARSLPARHPRITLDPLSPSMSDVA